MNDKNIGWLAGVLDGEGCIHASKPWKKENDRKSNGRYHFDIRVIITNNSTLLLEKVGSFLRECQIVYSFRDGCSKGSSEIAITRKAEIQKFLELILSELTCKKHSAEVVIRYTQKWPDSTTHCGRKGASEEQIKDYIKVYNILKKQKGKSPISLETTRYTSEVDEDIVRHSK